MKTTKGVEYKSTKEVKEAHVKLRTERDAAMAPFLPETKDGLWKATTAEQRSQWAEMGKDLLELKGLMTSEDELKSISEQGNYDEPKHAANFPKGGYGGGARNEMKSLGESFIESAEYKAQVGKMHTHPSFSFNAKDAYMNEFKAAATVEDTFFAPPNYRLPYVALTPQRKPIVQDIVPQIKTTDRNAVSYMLETLFTNNAAAVAQTVALAQSFLEYTAQTMPIRTIGTYIAVTEQMMEDNTGIMGVINNRLTLMEELAVETELLSGDGTGQHLTGFLNAGIGSQALGADDIYTAIAKGMNYCRFTGYAEPDYVVLNSADALTVRTKKDALGNFIFGPPNNTFGENIWGLPMITTNGITSGTALTGAFRAMSARYMARGITVEVGRINDNFITLEWAIRITEREALVVYRPSAFCKITGLASA